MFLFSLRYLTRQLQRGLSWRVRGWLDAALRTPFHCLVMGFLGSLLLQVSSITLFAAMGLLASRWIRLEQGFYLALGAGVGSTVGAWYAGPQVFHWGPAVVGVSSLSLALVRRTRWREGIAVVMAVGFALWGLHLLNGALSPLAAQEVVPLLHTLEGGLTMQFRAILVGSLLALATQSATLVVGLATALAQQNSLPYGQAASLILGANLGITLAPLFAALEYPALVRRLALAWLLQALMGVSLTWFFFPGFLRAVDLTVPGSPELQLQHHLAAVHTCFNVLSLICWGFFPGLILRPVVKLIPNGAAGEPELAPVVRRLLQRSPARAKEEAERQLRHLATRLKEMLEEIVHGLSQRGTQKREAALDDLMAEERQFRGGRETLLDLARAGLREEATREESSAQLRRLILLEQVFRHASELRLTTLTSVHQALPEPLQSLCQQQLAPLFDQLWLWGLGAAAEVEQPSIIDPFLEQLHLATCAAWGHGELDDEGRQWLFDFYLGVRNLLLAMEEAAEMNRRADSGNRGLDHGTGESTHQS